MHSLRTMGHNAVPRVLVNQNDDDGEVNDDFDVASHISAPQFFGHGRGFSLKSIQGLTNIDAQSNMNPFDGQDQMQIEQEIVNEISPERFNNDGSREARQSLSNSQVNHANKMKQLSSNNNNGGNFLQVSSTKPAGFMGRNS